MSQSYFLAEGLVIELNSNGECNVIIPSRRHRLRVGLGVLGALCEIARVNARGTGVTAADLGASSEIEGLFAQLLSLGVIAERRQNDVERSRDLLSLVERATLRIAQVGGCFQSGLLPNVTAPLPFTPSELAGEPVTLPPPETPVCGALWEIIASRRSRRGGPRRELAAARLSALLACSLRVQRRALDTFGPVSFRPVASGGARHPVDAFLSILRVSEFHPGVYQYDPLFHALRPLATEIDGAEVLARTLLTAMSRPPEILPAVSFLFTVVPARTGCKYTDSALLTIAKDIGCLIQQLYLITEGLGLSGCAIDGTDTGVIEAILGTAGTDRAFLGGFVIW